jgi:hypothetical protein
MYHHVLRHHVQYMKNHIMMNHIMKNQVVVVLIGKGLGGVDTGHKIVIVKVVHVMLGGDHNS